MLSVIEAKYIKDFRIYLKFNDGKTGEVDLEDFIMKETRPVFFALKKQENFRSFDLNFDTVTWENNKIDLAPEFLYFKAFKDKPELQAKFKKWGYIN